MELFTAFLWLVECSVLFVFMLLIFYLNVKCTHDITFSVNGSYVSVLPFVVTFTCCNYTSTENNLTYNTSLCNLLDNYYEAFCNCVNNDLFGFSTNYYLISGVEFIIVGFLLLFGSVLCINLHAISKCTRSQTYCNHISVFDFFTDLINFAFIKKQNTTKQGNSKASTNIFTSK